MSYRSERFNGRMISLDACLSGYSDPSKARMLCDGGNGLERLLSALDYSPERETETEARLSAARLAQQKERLVKLSAAIGRLVVAEKAHLVPTLLLIARNGADREKSFELMPGRTYRRHRRELCEFFDVEI